MLSFMVAWRQAQQLRHAGGWRVIGVGRRVGNVYSHNNVRFPGGDCGEGLASSCPGTSRASTSFSQTKDVDGRNKSRHDRYCSCQKLLGDRGAEPVVLDNELADELVQAPLKDPIHTAVLQPRANAAGLPLRRALPAIGVGDRIEIAHDGLV